MIRKQLRSKRILKKVKRRIMKRRLKILIIRSRKKKRKRSIRLYLM